MCETGHILIVCRANVCRSALAELVLANTLPTRIDVESAGIAAAPGTICALVQGWDPRPSWLERANLHEPRQVTEDALHRADLILAASVAIRGDIARLAPTARTRMFTLVEAARLGAGFEDVSHDRNVVTDYVEHLDRQRLHLPASNSARRRGKRHHADDPLSIPDSHGRRKRHHRDALSLVQTAAQTISQQLLGSRSQGSASVHASLE